MWFAPKLRPGLSGRPLLSVQVLRAVAALTVVVHHAGYDADWLATQAGVGRLDLDRYFDWGIGVHLFFVISGFIMVRTAGGFGEPGAPWRFLRRRLLRVVPLYWLMTTLVLAGAVAAPDLLNTPVDGWSLLFGSYLFVPVTRVEGVIRPILGQGWTLDYEMFFYVLFALAMVLPRRLGLPALAAALLGLVILGRLLHPAWPPATVWTDGLLLEFLLGGMIGAAAERGVRLGAMAAAAAVLAGVALAVWIGPLNPRFEGLDPWIRGGLPAALVVAGCVFGPAWPISRGLLPLGAVGDASYSLYLTHPFTIRVLRVAWANTLASRWPVSIFLATSILAAIGVGLLIYRCIERPMTLALRRRFPERLPQAAPGGPEARGRAARRQTSAPSGKSTVEGSFDLGHAVPHLRSSAETSTRAGGKE